MTSALFETSFPVTCIYLGKVFHHYNVSMFHFHGFHPVSRNCLHVAMQKWYITLAQNFWRCLQTRKVQITLWCLNFDTVHKGNIQCPPPHFTICSECFRRPCFRPCFRKFSPRGRVFAAPPAPSPWHDISTPKNKDTPLVFKYLRVRV